MKNEIKINTTISLISLDRKLSDTNYPNIVYKDDKITKTEAQARIAILNNSWMNVDSISLEELMELVVNKGKSFVPSAFNIVESKSTGYSITTDFYVNKFNRTNGETVIGFKNKRTKKYDETYTKASHVTSKKNETFKSCQLLCIDVDKGYNSLEELQQFIQESPMMDCSFIYPTFSYTDTAFKVRVGWLLDKPITEYNEFRYIIINLINMFNSDQACKDAARLYYPANKQIGLLYSNYNITFSKELFINTLPSLSTNSKKSQSMYNNILYTNCDENGFVERKQTQEDFKQKMIELGYTYYTDDSHTNNLIRNFNFEYAIENNSTLIKLINEHLSYSELFLLAVNLAQVEGGIKFLNEVMNLNNNNGLSHYNNSDFEIINSVRKYNYIPKSTFFFYDCYPQPDYYVKQIKTEKPMITLKEAELKLKEFYREAMLARNTNIHIVKVPTGLGKTKLIEDIETLNAVLAFPNHMLKDEVSGRISEAEFIDDTLFRTKRKLNNKFVVTPKLPELSKELTHKVNYLYKVGLSQEVSKLFDDVKKHPSNYAASDVEKVLEYRQQLFECFKGEVNVVTTHKMTQYIDFKQNTIIYDEDPFSSIIELSYITGKDLKHLFDIAKDKKNSVLGKIVAQIKVNLETAVSDQIFNHIELSPDNKLLIIEELKKEGIYSSNIIGFITCSSYYLHYSFDKDGLNEIVADLINPLTKINFVTRTDLPMNKKIIIFSATISENIYKQLYGDRVKFYNIDNVETVGEVFQDTRYSYTRSCLNFDKITGRGNVRKYINKELSDKNIDSVITYKGYNDIVDNTNEEIYFGNCVGFDELKGKNIAIVGTPYYNEWSYVLMAKAINPNKRFNNVKFQKREVEFGNFLFKINTFEEDILKDLHLEMTTSEVIQAIGRARVLREKCNVYLFSNIPIDGATQKYIK